MAWYRKATQLSIPTGNTSLALDQARARCRLVHLLITDEKKYSEALQQLRLVEPYLDQMKGHVSSETVTQAREARYHLGKSHNTHTLCVLISFSHQDVSYYIIKIKHKKLRDG